MIEFDCPHCGNHLSHQEAFAGRDGWCRICKGVISIPAPGQLAATELNLNLEQRYARLERLFKHAVSIVDEHRQLQASLQNGGDGLIEALRLRTEAEQAANALSVQLDEASTLHRSTEAVCEELRARVDALESDNGALSARAESDATERSNLQETLVDVTSKADQLPGLQTELSDAKSEINGRQQENDELLERVLELEQKLETAEELASQALEDRATERDAYEQRLAGLRDELCAAEEEGAALHERLSETAELEARLLSDLDEARKTAVGDRDRLERETERLSSRYEAEAAAHLKTIGQLKQVSVVADLAPGLEEELANARTELEAGEERHQMLLRRVADLECAAELAGERAKETRSTWDTQRRQLMEEMETYRAGQRTAEEETAQARAKAREAAADLQSQLDLMQTEVANESRLRIASEEREQRLQRNMADANAAREQAMSRSDQLSQRLESESKALASTREEAAALRVRILDHESAEQDLQSQLEEAHAGRDSAIGERDATEGRLNDASEKLLLAQQKEEQHQTRIAELERAPSSRDEDGADALERQDLSEIATLKTELKEMHEMAEELNNELDATNREKTRLEQRLTSAENRTAFSELEGTGYRTKFSSMAKQFFEQEVARQSSVQDEPSYDSANAVDIDTASVLDAVTQVRK